MNNSVGYGTSARFNDLATPIHPRGLNDPPKNYDPIGDMARKYISMEEAIKSMNKLYHKD